MKTLREFQGLTLWWFPMKLTPEIKIHFSDTLQYLPIQKEKAFRVDI